VIAPARIAAYAVLRAVGSGNSDLPGALARVRATLPDERDRALAGEIATGTLRWQGSFDAIIAAFTSRAAARMDPEVLDILRLTIFQLLHLDRIPASAAVNDAVQLARKAGKQSASGLVNAVLRRVSRERRQLPLPVRPASGADLEAARAYLSVTLSHPRWLMERWLDRYGLDATETWAQFDNGPAPLTLRAIWWRTTREQLAASLAAHGVDTEPARFAPGGLVVRSGNPLLSPIANDGTFVVQDEASQLVGVFAGARPGDRALDACASPGGKTTQLAAAVGDGLVVASDVRRRRVDLLVNTIRTTGAKHVRVVRADATGGLPFDAQFDLVLLDAPCSGLGTLRRDPDIRWRRTADDLPVLAEAQFAMLNEAARVLRPGGRLVYATCSSEPEENELVVERFVRARPQFAPAPADAIPEPVRPFLDTRGHFRTLPFRDQLEAFFAAMLVKTKDLQ
jgi:16S rRNA (cytosine967-C5)-methyltransferase